MGVAIRYQIYSVTLSSGRERSNVQHYLTARSFMLDHGKDGESYVFNHCSRVLQEAFLIHANFMRSWYWVSEGLHVVFSILLGTHSCTTSAFSHSLADLEDHTLLGQSTGTTLLVLIVCNGTATLRRSSCSLLLLRFRSSCSLLLLAAI